MVFLGKMCFTGNESFQKCLAFTLILSSLILDNNKKVTNWISIGISSEKNKLFDINLN